MKPLEEMGKYATVVVDPPWLVSTGPTRIKARNGGYAPMPYNVMEVSELAVLRIGHILADDSLLFCWTTHRFLPSAINLISDWQATYRFTMVWHKPGGPQIMNTPAFNCEFIIVGSKGKPQFLDTKAFATANYWPRGGHSEKPEGFYDLLRRVTPGPRLDIFGRRRIAGFESWGNEAPEGDALPDHYQQVLMG